MTGYQCDPQSIEVPGGPIKLLIPGIPGPVAPFVAPHLVGRVEETGNLVPIPLSAGLSIVNGLLTIIGTGSGGTGYIHSQLQPSTSWIINHGLGYRPAVDIVDLGGNRLYCHVQHASVFQAVASFNLAVGGYARAI